MLSHIAIFMETPNDHKRLQDKILLDFKTIGLDVKITRMDQDQMTETFDCIIVAARLWTTFFEKYELIDNAASQPRICINSAKEFSQNEIENLSWDQIKTLNLAQKILEVIKIHKILEKQKQDHPIEENHQLTSNIFQHLTPILNNLLGGITLSKKSENLDECLEHLELVENSTSQLFAFTEQIKTQSLLNSPDFKLSPKEFNIRQLVEATLSQFIPQATNRKIVLANIIEPDVPSYIFADSNCLRQIISNLISHGMQHTYQGMVLIRGKIRRNGELLFEVEDTGPGIKSGQDKLIFKPYSKIKFNEYDTYEPKLTLSTANKCVEKLDGNIGFRSKEGIGSIFWFSFKPKRTKKILRPNRQNFSKTKYSFVGSNQQAFKVLKEQFALRGIHLTEKTPTSNEPVILFSFESQETNLLLGQVKENLAIALTPHHHPNKFSERHSPALLQSNLLNMVARTQILFNSTLYDES